VVRGVILPNPTIITTTLMDDEALGVQVFLSVLEVVQDAQAFPLRPAGLALALPARTIITGVYLVRISANGAKNLERVGGSGARRLGKGLGSGETMLDGSLLMDLGSELARTTEDNRALTPMDPGQVGMDRVRKIWDRRVDMFTVVGRMEMR
jgi:hypothetical protein